MRLFKNAKSAVKVWNTSWICTAESSALQ